MEIVNKRAYKDYEVFEKLEAGITLNGGEVRAVKQGRADLMGSFVRIIGSEAYLVNAKIFPVQSQTVEGFDLKRTRKLLLHKKEIIALKGRISGSDLTIIPLVMYDAGAGSLVKLQIALARGLRKFDKKRKKR